MANIARRLFLVLAITSFGCCGLAYGDAAGEVSGSAANIESLAQAIAAATTQAEIDEILADASPDEKALALARASRIVQATGDMTTASDLMLQASNAANETGTSQNTKNAVAAADNQLALAQAGPVGGPGAGPGAGAPGASASGSGGSGGGGATIVVGQDDAGNVVSI